MDIDFKNTKLAKLMNSETALKREFGDRMARTIQMRLQLLRHAPSLADVPTTPPPRRHQLSQDRDEQFAVDLVHPYRLIFEVNQDPIPRKEDNGVDVTKVTAVKVLEVADYH